MEKAEAGSVERTVAESQSEMTEVIMPNDTNMMGTLMGGRLTQLIDIAGGIAASRQRGAIRHSVDGSNRLHRPRSPG